METLIVVRYYSGPLSYLEFKLLGLRISFTSCTLLRKKNHIEEKSWLTRTKFILTSFWDTVITLRKSETISFTTKRSETTTSSVEYPPYQKEIQPTVSRK